MPIKPIPEGYHTVTPYLTVDNADELIGFLQRAFQAEVTFRMNNDEGRVRHAELRVGDSMVMVANATSDWKARAAAFYLYVPDCDAVYERALQAGATSIMPPADQFYGDRSGGVRDGFGNDWWIGTRIENVSSEEMKVREAAQRKR